MIFDEINYSIHTDRLYLRLFEKNDAETIKKLCNDFNIYKHFIYHIHILLNIMRL